MVRSILQSFMPVEIGISHFLIGITGGMLEQNTSRFLYIRDYIILQDFLKSFDQIHNFPIFKFVSFPRSNIEDIFYAFKTRRLHTLFVVELKTFIHCLS